MNRLLYFISHPNVVIDSTVPVTMWQLSEVGKRRMRAGLSQPWLSTVSSIYSSTERKAIDGAEIVANHLGLPYKLLHDLGENDRSATGFLPPSEFEEVAHMFFAVPDESIRGWERAIDAQSRIVQAVKSIADSDTTDGSIVIVSHGAVGTLLYCWLTSTEISRNWEQPPNGGGNYYAFELQPRRAHSHWLQFNLGLV